MSHTQEIFFLTPQLLYHLDWSIASSGFIKLTGLLLLVLVEWNPAIKKVKPTTLLTACIIKRISSHYQSVEFNSSSHFIQFIHHFCAVCLFNSSLIVLNDAVYELITITIRLGNDDQWSIHCWLISHSLHRDTVVLDILDCLQTTARCLASNCCDPVCDWFPRQWVWQQSKADVPAIIISPVPLQSQTCHPGRRAI